MEIEKVANKWAKDRSDVVPIQIDLSIGYEEGIKSEAAKQYWQKGMYNWADIERAYIMGLLNRMISIDELLIELPKRKDRLNLLKKLYNQNQEQ